MTMDRLIDGTRRLGFELNNRQVEQFEAYYHVLVEWNKKVNLTSITAYEDVQIKHFLDSLTVTLAFRRGTNYDGLRVIDVGTGAGMPGIPLKILLPEIRLTLLEATEKKAAFLRHVIGKLGLDDVEVVSGRAEDVAHKTEHREKYDLVLSRAVAALPTLVELTLPFCAVGGMFVAQKQAEAKPEVEQAARAVDIMGGRLREIIDIDLPEISGRCLVVYDKVSPTPPEYPRRPGVPAKGPIM
ncbi:MAG: 16S rRNA (guanine(527)-N(7))-methyltransferase [Chloroflexi bacterium RBG_16_57_8]|nr:MAG: 16S rRNA (guanine(527)-N(7))-methyltransferase [Chloroflexi bacterium RBG_16_57_8]